MGSERDIGACANLALTVLLRWISCSPFSPPQRGSINLWTVRHDEGQIRHVFRPDASSSAAAAAAEPQGHSPKAAVSTLALNNDETGFLSGGWDGRIIVRPQAKPSARSSLLPLTFV